MSPPRPPWPQLRTCRALSRSSPSGHRPTFRKVALLTQCGPLVAPPAKPRAPVTCGYRVWRDRRCAFSATSECSGRFVTKDRNSVSPSPCSSNFERAHPCHCACRAVYIRERLGNQLSKHRARALTPHVHSALLALTVFRFFLISRCTHRAHAAF